MPADGRSLNASLKKEVQNKIIIFIKEFRDAQSKNCASPETVMCNASADMNKTFKYEFGISLCNQDLTTAREIVRLSSISKDKIFLYEHKQQDLVAQNLVLQFPSIFKNDCRVIVVLHRSDYGKSDYTNLEETSITERILKERNKNFIFFVKMDTAELPTWYDPHYGHVRRDKFTLEAITQLIDSKVREQGGQFEDLTIDEKILKYDANLTLELEIKAFEVNASMSPGFENYTVEMAKIYDGIQNAANKFDKHRTLAMLKVKGGEHSKEFYRLFHHRSGVGFEFNPESPKPETVNLFASFQHFKGTSSNMQVHKSKWLLVENYYFSMNENREFVWRPLSQPRHYITSEELVDRQIKLYLDFISENSLELL